jgi:hypothetical protein
MQLSLLCCDSCSLTYGLGTCHKLIRIERIPAAAVQSQNLQVNYLDCSRFPANLSLAGDLSEIAA